MRRSTSRDTSTMTCALQAGLHRLHTMLQPSQAVRGSGECMRR